MNALTPPERTAYKPFTRVISTPPAWPWVQTRVAQLEAQHTSPVAGDDVAIIVKRLQPWTLGQAGKFVAVYVRGADSHKGLKFTVDIQGKSITIDLPSAETRAEHTNARMWRVGSGAVIAIGIACLIMLTLQRRAAEEARLTELETRIERQWRQANGVLRAKQDAQGLAELELDKRTFDKAIGDLKYLTSARDTSVRIETFYWNQGYWGVEARGSNAPIKAGSATLERSVKPVRTGVWLWVVSDRETQP